LGPEITEEKIRRQRGVSKPVMRRHARGREDSAVGRGEELSGDPTGRKRGRFCLKKDTSLDEGKLL